MRKLVFCTLVLLFLPTFFGGEAQHDTAFNQVFIPAKYAEMMKQQILIIEKNGWGKLGVEDLNHGHLVLKAQKTLETNFLAEPVSVEKLFSASAGVLYHTDESLLLWRFKEGNLPLEAKHPRSFFAYWNGEVVLASSFFEKAETETAHFSCCGTVHTDELAKVKPEEFAFWRSYQVVSQGSKPCYVNSIVDIYFSSRSAPTIVAHGKPYVMTMDCKEVSW